MKHSTKFLKTLWMNLAQIRLGIDVLTGELHEANPKIDLVRKIADETANEWGELDRGLQAWVRRQARKERETVVTYRAYLESSWWFTQREATLLRDGHACQVCSSKDRLNVHHRTYARLWDERPEDLVTLCRKCHELFHRNGKLAKPPVDLSELEVADGGTS